MIKNRFFQPAQQAFRSYGHVSAFKTITKIVILIFLNIDTLPLLNFDRCVHFLDFPVDKDFRSAMFKRNQLKTVMLQHRVFNYAP